MQETPHPPHRSEVPSVGCSHVLWRTKYLGQVNLLCVFSSPTPVDSKSSWIFWAQIFSLTSWSKKDLGQKIFVRDWTGTLHYFGAFLTPPPPLHFPFQSDTSTTYKIKQLPNRPPLSTKGENCLEDDFKRYLSHFLSFSLSTGMSFTRNVWILGWSSRGRAPSANRTSQTTTGDGWLPVVPAASVASAVVQHRRVASRRKRKYRAWSNSRVCR